MVDLLTCEGRGVEVNPNPNPNNPAKWISLTFDIGGWHSPPHPGKVQIPHPWECFLPQNSFTPQTHSSDCQNQGGFELICILSCLHINNFYKPWLMASNRGSLISFLCAGCNASYICKTIRHFSSCPWAPCIGQGFSCLQTHCFISSLQRVLFYGMTILDTTSSGFQLKIKEVMYIK